MKKFYDIVLVGGGLANSLLAHRLKNVRPDVEFLLLEQNSAYGGNHTWSFHESDLTAIEWSWVAPLVSTSWEATEVRFPGHSRLLPQRYHSVRSSRLRELLSSELTYQVGHGQKAVDVTPTQVILDDGFAVQASCVIDGRGWLKTPGVTEAFQKFFGMDIELKNPHGLTHPILMDATVPQTDGYRFVYVLPWDERRLLVEDTYYSDTPFLNIEGIRNELLRYTDAKGWVVKATEREEHGVLSIPLEGRLPGWKEGVPLSGTRGGFFHATTGYSFPFAVRFAEAIAHLKTFEAPKVFAAAKSWATRHWTEQAFFRRLNRMMFRACEPDERYKILESFYKQPKDLIDGFYRGRLSVREKIRMFMHKSPVPVGKALRCLWEKSVL